MEKHQGNIGLLFECFLDAYKKQMKRNLLLKSLLFHCTVFGVQIIKGASF